MAYSGRITKPVFKVRLLRAALMNKLLNARQGVSGTLFSIAIIAAIARTVIRFRVQRRLLLDDFLLGLACVCLIAANILLYEVVPLVYLGDEAIFDYASVKLSPGVLRQASTYQKMLYSNMTLTWAVIYSVKCCFLCLFRQLIDRLKNMIRYWRFVVGITAISFGFCICNEFISCPHFGLSSACGFSLWSLVKFMKLTLFLNSGMCRRPSSGKAFPAQLFQYLVRCLDRSNELSGIRPSDQLFWHLPIPTVVTIPIWLLWKVKLKPRQKLGLGVFLCLSTSMIVIAVVRIGGLRIDAKVDIVWEVFWQQVECCIAISMVSFTAFRSFFVYDGPRRDGQKVRQWYSSPKRLWNQKNYPMHEHDLRISSAMPSPTSTGIRTFIHGSPGKPSWGYERNNEASEVSPQYTTRIKVTQDIFSEVENVRGILIQPSL